MTADTYVGASERGRARIGDGDISHARNSHPRHCVPLAQVLTLIGLKLLSEGLAGL